MNSKITRRTTAQMLHEHTVWKEQQLKEEICMHLRLYLQNKLYTDGQNRCLLTCTEKTEHQMKSRSHFG